MKNLKYNIGLFILLAFVLNSCQEDDFEFGTITAPTNIQIQVDKVGADATNPNGNGSGTVNFTASADNATAIHFIIQDQTKLAVNGKVSHDFAILGTNTYPITVIAYGIGGVSSSMTINIEVLSLYEPPADLLQMLYANGSRTWRIKNEVGGHFGLGPVGGDNPFQWFSAGANDKVGVGMYDDRYIFSEDGTFTHITDNTNDDPVVDTSGTVFGREVLIDELGGSGGTQNGADIENYVFSDYSEQWSLAAPGGVETITLTGTAFIGYYIGGDHTYKIVNRSANEMVLMSIDGNNEFNWGFALIAE